MIRLVASKFTMIPGNSDTANAMEMQSTQLLTFRYHENLSNCEDPRKQNTSEILCVHVLDISTNNSMPEMDEVPCFGKTETFFLERFFPRWFPHNISRRIVGCFVPDWSIPGLVHAL